MNYPFKTNEKPDILLCLANLSEDEIFTPPKTANDMLDLLPQKLFRNPFARFLDPACKSGVFLREIVKRLNIGLADKIPDLQERINHIMNHQVFGISVTELTAKITRRTVYCSMNVQLPYCVCKFTPNEKFLPLEGRIHFRDSGHVYDKKGKCIYCGAKQKEEETLAYEFIHTKSPEEILGMKFDVVISNPPYQMSDGGSAGGAMPMYQYFVEQAKKLDPKYIVMIIPARWYAGGRGLDDFRKEMLNDSHIRVMVDYPKSKECFNTVDVAGGVCYFLWERDYNGPCTFTSITRGQKNTRERIMNEYDIFIRDNVGIDIIHKIQDKTNDFMSRIVEPVSPFGLRSFTRGKPEYFPDAVTLISSAGKSYISRAEVKKGHELIDKYKVVIGYLNPDRAGVNNASDGKSNVTTKISIYEPGEVITETYIIIGSFKTMEEAKNCRLYMSTKFARYLVFLTLSSMHITKVNFQFVPMQDFSRQWTDSDLYAKYGLSDSEIAFIDSMIRPMNLKEDSNS